MHAACLFQESPSYRIHRESVALLRETFDSLANPLTDAFEYALGQFLFGVYADQVDVSHMRAYMYAMADEASLYDPEIEPDALSAQLVAIVEHYLVPRALAA